MPTQKLLAHGRAAAERLMTDTCVLRRPNDTFHTDPETGQTVPGFDIIFPELICKVQSNSPVGNMPESGGHRYTIEQLRVHMPVGTDAWARDEVQILSSETDPDNLGRIFTLTELNRGTHRTSQRWAVELVTR